ncbi:hypothetical protein EFL26_15890 [Nocardioides pocheonensis]|uniref:Uncharacterized protein n=1 Tax=Nocardioides pocheonensis TaxID=661485 RepID=A0A3N0GLE0_9ACTN|nr:hypothetical protein EFL26_15890 [Nocardioides pocheonensis]
MSTNVIDLTARLQQSPAPCGCTRHMFEAVMERAQSQLGGSLLVSRDVLEGVIADIGVTLEAVLTPSQGMRP